MRGGVSDDTQVQGSSASFDIIILQVLSGNLGDKALYWGGGAAGGTLLRAASGGLWVVLGAATPQLLLGVPELPEESSTALGLLCAYST